MDISNINLSLINNRNEFCEEYMIESIHDFGFIVSENNEIVFLTNILNRLDEGMFITINEEDLNQDDIFINDILFYEEIEEKNNKLNDKEIKKKLGSYNRIKKDDKHIGDCCNICYDEFKINQGKRVLSCNHYFHKKCIDTWLKKGSHTCPLCRLNPLKQI